MDAILFVIFFFFISLCAFFVFKKHKSSRQLKFINNYKFPQSIPSKIKLVYPELSDAELDQVMKGLKAYFLLIYAANKEAVSMPSQVVDVAWHEFILFTKEYSRFCLKAFGYYIHHTPSEAMKTEVEAVVGIKRAWELACNRENINSFTPNRLPLIFALDGRLNIKDGFFYKLNCLDSLDNKSNENRKTYCASHISSSVDYAPNLDGKPVGGGSGCSGGGSSNIGCSSSGCSGGCGGN